MRSSLAKKVTHTTENCRKISIIGPVNAGKSAIFNRLTGDYSDVANYPQTTLRSRQAGCTIGGCRYVVSDTPGINTLSITSEDEEETRTALIIDRPDLILFVADAARLKRSLVLYSQIVELKIPMVFVLNKSDTSIKTGININIDRLRRMIRTDVIELSAVGKGGFDRLEKSIGKPAPVDDLVDFIKPNLLLAVRNIVNDIFSGTRFGKAEALLLLSGDNGIKKLVKSELGQNRLETACAISDHLRREEAGLDVGRFIFSRRQIWADNVAEEVLKSDSFSGTSLSQRLGSLSRHPVYGWPVLLLVMWITFQGVGLIASSIAAYLDAYIFLPLTHLLGSVIPYPFIHDFLLGDFGILTMGVMNALVTVVPILIIFFIIVNFLEDVGYLPNLSVLSNRLFLHLGLTGKSVLTLSLGFGCGTMATMTSRTLDSKKERIIACFLIALGIPCAVQLGVMIAILQSAGFLAQLLVIGTVFATQVISGMLLNKLVKSDKRSDFIMELPAFKMPVWKNIFRKTYIRVKYFLIEAVPLFVLGAALMFTLEKTGLLRVIEAVMHPLVAGLLSMPDKVTEVFILVISRRELGAVYFKGMVDAGELEFAQVVVGLTVMTLFIPCISNTMMMFKELGTKATILINCSIIAIAILVGALQNFLIRAFY